MKRNKKKSKATLLRNKTGMTQAEVAERVGIAKNYLSAIECGRGTPGEETLAKIAKVLGVSARRYLNALS